MIRHRSVWGCRQVAKLDYVSIEPLLVRVLGRQIALDLIVTDDASLCCVDEEDPARVKAPFHQYLFRWNVQDANFRRHNNQVVFSNVVSGRSQPVAIEYRADQRAVGERDGGGAIPGLH